MWVFLINLLKQCNLLVHQQLSGYCKFRGLYRIVPTIPCLNRFCLAPPPHVPPRLFLVSPLLLRLGIERHVGDLPAEGIVGRASHGTAHLRSSHRYYTTYGPTDDHGARSTVLFIPNDDLATVCFLRVVGDEMARAKVDVPLQVAYISVLERLRPLGTPRQAFGH